VTFAARVTTWLAALAVAGLLVMHGIAGNHGDALPAATPQMTVAHTTGAHETNVSTTSVAPTARLAVRADTMNMHAMTSCVALAAATVLLIVAASYLARGRTDAHIRARQRRALTVARSPPCPPSFVRGVCLT
jgi:hypothetical protein